MKKTVGIATIALLLLGGGTTAMAADKSMDQKGQMSDQNKSSKQGKQNQPNAGGPMGETEAGGAGPSGPSPLPPGSSPGFEGAGKDHSRGPTSGGPR